MDTGVNLFDIEIPVCGGQEAILCTNSDVNQLIIIEGINMSVG